MAGRRRYHFHPPFLLYAGVTILLGIGAVNSQNNLLFFAFGAALGALLVSGVVSGGMLMGVEAERTVPERGRVGVPLTIGYAVRNRNRWRPAFGLRIEERAARRQTGERVPSGAAFLSYVPRRSTRHASLTTTPKRRGAMELASVRIVSGFPFGILRKSVTFDQPATALIHPEHIDEAARLFTALAGVGGEAGSSRASLGRGADLHGLREYTPGDSLRSIAWRASARRDELIVREHAAPGATQLWIALDLSGGEGSSADRAQNERAIAVAGTLVEQGASSGAPVGLVVPAIRLDRTPRSGGLHSPWLRTLLDDLALLDLDGPDVDLEHAPPARPGTMIVVHARDAGAHLGPAGAHHVSAESISKASSPSPKEVALA